MDVGIAITRKRVADFERLQRQQHGTKVGGVALDALGQQRHTATVACEHLQNQAGLAPVIAVQDKGGFITHALGGHRFSKRQKGLSETFRKSTKLEVSHSVERSARDAKPLRRQWQRHGKRVRQSIGNARRHPTPYS